MERPKGGRGFFRDYDSSKCGCVFHNRISRKGTSMATLLAKYQPHPIGWPTVHNQEKPSTIEVKLIVRAVDADTLIPVDALVTSNPPVLGDLVPDPNNLSFPTNVLTSLTVIQLTSYEVPGTTQFLPPGVKVSADGYEEVFLSLE
jgi:hypothetical protein